jgi:hypothetical protein
MFRGDSMKSVFILLISFSLFISGCELIEEDDPQFRMYMMEVPVCDRGENCGTLGGGGGTGGGTILSTICENAFYGTCGTPSGGDNTEVHCSATHNLGCSGLCYVTIDSPACGLSDPGLGDCYCLNDGVCDDDYGEPLDSDDCADCTSGETESCDLPQVPGTCGECNEGLNTCVNGQWGTCDQVVSPIVEDCDNGLDDDCDCSPDATDADCFYTHLECVSNDCVEVDGQGTDQCSYVGELCGYQEHAACLGDRCVMTPGPGDDTCENDEDCGAVGIGICGDEVRNRIDPNTGEIEQCDWPDLGGETCESQGYVGGDLGCTNACYFDTSECYYDAPCSIDHLNWEGGSTSYGVLYRMVDTEAELQVFGDSNCVGKTVSFEVMEDDAYGDDPVNVEPVNAVFVAYGNGAIAKSSWIVEDQNDGLIGSPEYYFNADVIHESSASSANYPLLYAKDYSLNCDSGDVASECITNNQYPAISYFRDGDATCEFYDRECFGIEYSRHVQDGGDPEWVRSSLSCESPIYITYPSDVFRAVCKNYGGYEYPLQGDTLDLGAGATSLVDYQCEQCSYDDPSMWNYDLENCAYGVTGMRLRSFDCDQQYGNCITLDIECDDGEGGNTYIGYSTKYAHEPYYTLARRDSTIYAVEADTPSDLPNTYLECGEDYVVIGARFRDFDCDRDSGTCVTLDLACGDGNGVEQYGLYKGYEHVPIEEYYDKSELRVIEVEQTQCGEGYSFEDCAEYQTEKYIRCDYEGKITGARLRGYDCEDNYDRRCVSLDVVCE